MFGANAASDCVPGGDERRFCVDIEGLEVNVGKTKRLEEENHLRWVDNTEPVKKIIYLKALI